MVRKNAKKGNQRAKNNTIKSLVKGAVKEALIAGGGALGGALGGAPGAMLGSKAGAFLSRITGFGDYVIRSNSLMNQRATGHTFGDDSRSIRVQHHEYLCDVTASEGFTIQRSVPLNPGLPSSFTWVAQLADAFQQYKLKGCVFYYRSTSAEWSGNGQGLGTVIMGTQYDVTRPDFTSKIEMENYLFSCSTKPSLDLVHPIECDNKESPVHTLYLRSGPLSDTQDPKFYDFANFQLAVVGCDASVEGQTIGELWVAYDVELYKPQYPPGGALPGQYFSRMNALVTAADPLGPIQTQAYGNLPVQIIGLGGGYDTIFFPKTISGGRFYICVSFKDGSTAAWTSPTVTLSNCSFDNFFPNGAGARNSPDVRPQTGCVVNQASYVTVVNINGYSASGSYVRFTWAAVPIASGSADVQIDVVCIPSINVYGA